MNAKINEYKMVINAIEFATERHGKQVRKGTKIPYVTHPVAVGMILAGLGCSQDLIVAGILHDCIEDAGVTFEEIASEFNAAVANIVRNCSEPDRQASWRTRKEQTLAHLKVVEDNACIVSCTDKLHNLLSIIRDYEVCGEELWTRFNASKEDEVWYYSSLGEVFASRSKTHVVYGDYEVCLDTFLKLVKL